MSVFSTDTIIEGVVTVDGSGVTQPVSGSVNVGNFPATQPVSGTVAVSNPGLTDTQLRASPVPISGTVTTTPSVSSTSTITQITSTGANQTLLAANASRKRLILFFSAGMWNVKLGVGASATSRTLLVSTSNYYLEIAGHTGQVDAMCTSSGKLVDVTELV